MNPFRRECARLVARGRNGPFQKRPVRKERDDADVGYAVLSFKCRRIRSSNIDLLEEVTAHPKRKRLLVPVRLIRQGVPQAGGQVDMPTLKLVRNLTYFNVGLLPNQ